MRKNLKIYIKGFLKGLIFIIIFVLLAIPTEFNSTYKKIYTESYLFNILGWLGGVIPTLYLVRKHNQQKAWILGSILIGGLILPFLFGNIELDREKLNKK